MIASKDYVLKIMENSNLFPKKKFSQNFLINADIANEIVNALDLKENEKVYEVGPGLGSLSEIILSKDVFLTCFEIDDRMNEHLKKTFHNYQKFSLVEGDFLKQNINFHENCKFISNLPYALTTPIIEKILLEANNITKFVFMVQKEVSQRLEAKSKTKDASPLSILIEHVGVLKRLQIIKKTNFFPIPNIDSITYCLTFNEKRDLTFDINFYKFLNLCFSMRRKTLVNNLIKKYKNEIIVNSLNSLNMSLQIRPEQISYKEFLTLFELINN